MYSRPYQQGDIVNVLQARPTKKIKSMYSSGCPHGLMVKAMDCGIVVSEFVLQSLYYVHFRAKL